MSNVEYVGVPILWCVFGEVTPWTDLERCWRYGSADTSFTGAILVKPNQLWVMVLLVIACALTGCETGGRITMSTPQAFTRERLIDDRFGEHQWWAGQLAKPDANATSYQGYVDLAILDIFRAKAAVAYGPGATTDAGEDDANQQEDPQQPPQQRQQEQRRQDPR